MPCDLSQEEINALMGMVDVSTGKAGDKTRYHLVVSGGGFNFAGDGEPNVIVATFKAWLQAIGAVRDATKSN